MNIRDFVDLDKLQKIQDLFSASTGLAAIAVYMQGEYLTKGSGFTEFCMQYTRQSPLGAQRCQKCDNEGHGSYVCHAGLMDFSEDIVVAGEKVGAIIGGQVLFEKPDDEKFRKIAHELNIPEDAYLRALHKVSIRSLDEIHAAVGLLGETVNNLVNFSYFSKLNDNKQNVMDHEMKEATEAVDSIMHHMKNLESVATKERLLSFNASVEAARAGEAGKVFVVVADEMRSLAGESAETYKQIKSEAERVSLNVHKVQKALN